MLLTTLRNCFFVVVAGAIALPAVSVAQPAEGEAPGDGAGESGETPEKPPVDPEKMKAAQVLAGEAMKHYQAGEYEQALEKFQGAYKVIPDPNLLVFIGNSHSGLGNSEEALAAWKKYLEAQPEGQFSPTIRTNVEKAEAEIAEAAATKKRQEELAKKQQEEAERKRIEAERKEAAKLPLAADVMLAGGMDSRSSPTVRILAGGMLRFGKFAPEAHVGFDGLFRSDDDKGTSAQGFTILDLGVRYAFSDKNFVGPFIGAGGSFGVFVGEPNEVRLNDDPQTCAGSDDGVCSFEVDKYITGRFGVGYGFRSSDKATVALRLDATLWWYSVQSDQGPGNVPAGLVDKPQTALSVLVGLEFMRWR